MVVKLYSSFVSSEWGAAQIASVIFFATIPVIVPGLSLVGKFAKAKREGVFYVLGNSTIFKIR